jgi:hypothetical protein
VPAQNGVRRYQASNLRQQFAAEHLAFDGQAATLVIVEKNSAFSEFFSEDLVLGAEVVNDLLLLPIDPASQDNE